MGITEQNSQLMLIVSYLVSYAQMGTACIWMDTRHNASACNERAEIEYQIVDGLISEQQSVSKVVSWQMQRPAPTQSMYLHALIIDSSSDRNESDSHKFKLIN